MTAKQTITFATFQELLPDSCNHPLKKQLRDKARYYGRKFLFKKQCDALVDFLNTNQTWIPLFQQNPYRFNALLATYCDKRFSATERLNAITNNLLMLEEKMGVEFCKKLLQEKSLLLAQLTDQLGIYFNINQIDPFEGYFSINLKDNDGRSIYDASFTFLKPNKLLIASIQGPSYEEAQEAVKQATKELHGVRPMFMLMNVFRLLAEKWQCELIGIPHTSQGKYRLSARSKILFNYDEFWQENQGQLKGQYWQLPLENARKPLEEIASKKRSMYRKRYEMLDEMSKNISNFEPKHG